MQGDCHVRKGDTVGVIAGRERGKRGKVLHVLTDKGRVLVEHINMIKKHQRPTQKLRQGGIIEREGPLPSPTCSSICARCDKPTRTGVTVLADGRKVRTCKRCGETDGQGLATWPSQEAPTSPAPEGAGGRQAGAPAPSSSPGADKGAPAAPAAKTAAQGQRRGPAAPEGALRGRTVIPALMKERGYANAFQVPRLEKIVLNMGVGEGKDNAKILDFATADLQPITGQKPIVTRAKKSIANFKLREGVPIGAKVTLRAAADVRVPRSARERRPAPRARLQGRAPQGLRRPGQLRAGAHASS